MAKGGVELYPVLLFLLSTLEPCLVLYAIKMALKLLPGLQMFFQSLLLTSKVKSKLLG